MTGIDITTQHKQERLCRVRFESTLTDLYAPKELDQCYSFFNLIFGASQIKYIIKISAQV